MSGLSYTRASVLGCSQFRPDLSTLPQTEIPHLYLLFPSVLILKLLYKFLHYSKGSRISSLSALVEMHLCIFLHFKKESFTLSLLSLKEIIIYVWGLSCQDFLTLWATLLLPNQCIICHLRLLLDIIVCLKPLPPMPFFRIYTFIMNTYSCFFLFSW